MRGWIFFALALGAVVAWLGVRSLERHPPEDLVPPKRVPLDPVTLLLQAEETWLRLGGRIQRFAHHFDFNDRRRRTRVVARLDRPELKGLGVLFPMIEMQRTLAPGLH